METACLGPFGGNRSLVFHLRHEGQARSMARDERGKCLRNLDGFKPSRWRRVYCCGARGNRIAGSRS